MSSTTTGTTTTHNITLIGLGAMGSSLASALLKPLPTIASSSNKISLTIHNRTPTRPTIPSLISQGATFAPTLAEALTIHSHLASDPSTTTSTLIFCLTSYPALLSLLATLPTPLNPSTSLGWLEGLTVLNLTNGTPSQARSLSSTLKKPVSAGGWGVSVYLDGAVMATPSMVGGPGSQIFVSGSGGASQRTAWEGIRDGWLAERLGEGCWFGADIGAAATQDLANLAAMYGLIQGGLTGMGLLKRAEGVDTAVLPAVQKYIVPLLANIVPVLGHTAQEWDEGVEEGGPHPLGMQHVALENIVRACEEEGVEVEALRRLRDLMGDAIEEGKEVEKGKGWEGGFTLVARRFLK